MPSMWRCALAAAGVALGLWIGAFAEDVPAEKTTKPHSCGEDNLPYQVVTLDTTYELHSWDWGTAKRTPHWILEKAKFPEISFINGCGISPRDSIAYCIVAHLYKGYLARVDAEGFAFVAATPTSETSVVGSFDENGTFYANRAQDTWIIHAPDALLGYVQPWEGMAKMEKMPVPTSTSHGADTVVWEGHLVSVSGGGIVVTDLTDPDMRTYLPTKAAGSDPMDSGYFGGAYLYSGSMYFSANSGEGIFEVQLDLAAGTYTSKLVGKSFVTHANDGLNCMFTEAPESAVGNPGDIKDAGLRATAGVAWAFATVAWLMLF